MLPLFCTWELKSDRVVCKRCGQPPLPHELRPFSRNCPALFTGSDKVLVYPVPTNILNGEATAGQLSRVSSWRPHVSSNQLEKTAAIIVFDGECDATCRLVVQCEDQGVATFVVDGRNDYQCCKGERVLRFSASGRESAGWAELVNLAVDRIRRQTACRFERFILLDGGLELAPDFFSGLIVTELETGACLVSLAQTSRLRAPQPRFEPAAAGEPSCLAIHQHVLETVGRLDAATFDESPDGAVIDFCLRARSIGLTTVHTHAASAIRRGQPPSLLAGDDAAVGLTRKWGPRWANSLSTLGTNPPCVVYTSSDDLRDPLVRPHGWRFVAFGKESSQPRSAWETRPRSESPDWYRLNADRLFPDAQASIWIDPSSVYLADWSHLIWHLGSFCVASYAHDDHVVLRRHDHSQLAALQEAWRRQPQLSSRAAAAQAGMPVGRINDSLPQHRWLESIT